MTDTGSENINAVRAAQGLTPKKPKGVPSKKEWDRIRMNRIGEAMNRYTLAGELIPQEWVDEYNALVRQENGEVTVSEEKYQEALAAFRSYTMPIQQFEVSMDDIRRAVGLRPVRGPKASDFVNMSRVCLGEMNNHHRDCLRQPQYAHMPADMDRPQHVLHFTRTHQPHPECGTAGPVSVSNRAEGLTCRLCLDIVKPKPKHFRFTENDSPVCGKMSKGPHDPIVVSSKTEHTTCEECKQSDGYKEAVQSKSIIHQTRGVRTRDLVPRCGATLLPGITQQSSERWRVNCEDCLRAVIEPENHMAIHHKTFMDSRVFCRTRGLNLNWSASWSDVTCRRCLRIREQAPTVHMDVKFAHNTVCGRDRRDYLTTIIREEVTCRDCKVRMEEEEERKRALAETKIVHAQKGPTELRSMCSASDRHGMTQVAAEIWKVTCTDCYNIATNGRGK